MGVLVSTAYNEYQEKRHGKAKMAGIIMMLSSMQCHSVYTNMVAIGRLTTEADV